MNANKIMLANLFENALIKISVKYLKIILHYKAMRKIQEMPIIVSRNQQSRLNMLGKPLRNLASFYYMTHVDNNDNFAEVFILHKYLCYYYSYYFITITIIAINPAM